MKYVHPDVIVAVHTGRETDQEADGIEVPLDLFKFNAAFAEDIAHRHIGDDNENQNKPYPRQHAQQTTEQASRRGRQARVGKAFGTWKDLANLRSINAQNDLGR